MPADKVVISDTSCLIGLTNIGKLDILKQLYGTVMVTPEVVQEYVLALPDWITVKEVTETSKTVAFNEILDLGESSAIALATEMDNVLLIVDERRARKAVMSQMCTGKR
jgi:predicted nucleic acid-binding protein